MLLLVLAILTGGVVHRLPFHVGCGLMLDAGR